SSPTTASSLSRRRPADFAVLPRHVCVFSHAELRCPSDDWHEFSEFCYKPYEQKRTWYEARASCRRLGAELVSIMSLTEQKQRTKENGKKKERPSANSDVWTGLNDLTVSGYVWSDGSPVTHTNWGFGEPNNHGGRENCVEMVTTNNGSSYWNDVNCDAHQDWVCMIAKGKTPLEPSVAPSPVPGTCP
uniref:C-type lectin domain-containing protein n=1 Tax=Electrophorus electricus TaxID=8005 RepID=A0A4W4GDL9_ELEEL